MITRIGCLFIFSFLFVQRFIFSFEIPCSNSAAFDRPSSCSVSSLSFWVSSHSHPLSLVAKGREAVRVPLCQALLALHARYRSVPVRCPAGRPAHLCVTSRAYKAGDVTERYIRQCLFSLGSKTNACFRERYYFNDLFEATARLDCR